ncbi:MAG: hypothetical protein U5K55_08895 [Aliarcobacter sp.]|nr:hypothetical protein [Aliarcobacter sp.]
MFILLNQLLNKNILIIRIFEDEAKNSVIRQKLVQKIVKGQLAIATQEDMELYYEKNKNQFLTANTFEIIQYSSKNKASLITALKNPDDNSR